MCHAHNYFPPFLFEDGKKFFLKNRPPENDELQWRTGVGVAEKKVEYTPDLIEHAALEFLEENASRPFFLFYCTNLPHANNEGGETPDGMEVDTYGEFESKKWKPNEKGFARMVQRIDRTVGRVMDKLRELGLEEDTIVIFSSDNGPHNEGGHKVTCFDSAGPFQGYKRSLHEGGIRVPFIVRCPRRIPGGRVCANLAYFPDLLPTFTELAGLNPAHGVARLERRQRLKRELGRHRHNNQPDILLFERIVECRDSRHRIGVFTGFCRPGDSAADQRSFAQMFQLIATVEPAIVPLARNRLRFDLGQLFAGKCRHIRSAVCCQHAQRHTAP